MTSDEKTSLEERVKELEARVVALEHQVGAPAPEDEPAVLEAEPAAKEAEPAAKEAEPAKEKKPDLESRLATTWLNRAGIVALVGGVSLLLIYAFPSLGATGKLLTGFAAAGVLVGLGLYLRRRYRVFGQVLFAGGLALFYFDTYALHFIPGLRVLESPVLPLVLMSLLVVGIVVAAQRMESEGVAGIALFLGYATAVIGQATAFTLVSVALLGGASIAFLVINRWVIVPVSSLVAVYVTHLLWMLGYPVTTLRIAPVDAFGVSLGALALYFVIFGAAPLLVRSRSGETEEGLSPSVLLLFGGLNWLGLFGLGLGEVVRHHADQLWLFALAVAAAMAALAAVARRSEGRELLFEVQAVLSVATLTVALGAGLPGPWVPLGWGLLGLCVVITGRFLRSLPLQIGGAALAMLAAAVQSFFLDDLAPPALGIVAALVLVERLGLQRPDSDRPSQSLGLGIPLVLVAGALLLGTLAQLAGGQWLTIGWLVAALALFGLGLMVRSRLYRLTALGALGLTLLKVVVYDLSQLTALVRIASVVVLGLVLLVVSFLYTRLEGRLNRSDGDAGATG